MATCNPNILRTFLVHLLKLVFLCLIISLKTESVVPKAQISVMGVVYCDVCSKNSFSRHSYFLPGAEVRIDCKFKAASALTMEQVVFSVNRTTNSNGVYKLEIPSAGGLVCAEAVMASSCQASLIGSSAGECNVPGYRITTDQIAFKSKRSNICIYGFNALNFRPAKKNPALCSKA